VEISELLPDLEIHGFIEAFWAYRRLQQNQHNNGQAHNLPAQLPLSSWFPRMTSMLICSSQMARACVYCSPQYLFLHFFSDGICDDHLMPRFHQYANPWVPRTGLYTLKSWARIRSVVIPRSAISSLSKDIKCR